MVGWKMLVRRICNLGKKTRNEMNKSLRSYFVITMGEVETSDGHTGVEHFENLLFRAARRSDRAEDFSLSLGVISR